jgi:hypothetical protein
MKTDEEQEEKQTFEIQNAQSDIKDAMSQVLKPKDMYGDIFTLTMWIAFVLFIGLFIFSFFKNGGVTDTVIRVFGYCIILITFIVSIRENFRDIAGVLSLENMCCDEYFIDSKSKIMVTISFIYYYLKTYITVLLNLTIVYIILYIIFLMFRNNFYYDDVVFKDRGEYGSVKYFFMIVYLVISFVVGLFLKVTYMTKTVAYMANPMTKLPVTINPPKPAQTVILILLFGIGIGFFYERLARLWTEALRSKTLLNLFDHSTLYKPLDFLGNPDVLKSQVKILRNTLVISFILAFFAIPRFDSDKYCTVTEEEAHKKLSQDADKFQSVFLLCYFLVCTVAIILHILQIVKIILASPE